MQVENPDIVRGTRVMYRVALIVGSSLLVTALIWPFIPALTGVGLLAMATRRPFAFLLHRLRNRTISALLGVTAVALGIVAPAVVVADWIALNAVQAFGFFRTPVFWNSLQRGVATVNAFTEAHKLLPIQPDISGMFQRLLNISASSLVSVLTGSIAAFTQIVAMLFLLFFWYRDGQRLQRSALKRLPFSRSELRFIQGRLRDTVRGTVFGRFLVAAMQGLLAWVAFLSLGVPGALLLGCLTSVCAIFPAVGAYLVWLPVVVYLVLVHAWARALILLIIGSALLSTIDNLLFPVIAGSKTRMSTPQMFLSLFGGVWAFGVSGLILGPLIWSFAESLFAIASGDRRALESVAVVAEVHSDDH